MPSYSQCIQKAVDAGNLRDELAQDLFGAENPDEAINEVLANLSRAKREAALQAVRVSQGYKNAMSHPDGGYYGLIALMTKDNRQKAKYENVEYLAKYYEGQYQAEFADALSRFRTKRLGFAQDKQGLEKMVRAVYGETVDDPDIVKFAAQFSEINEKMRLKFNEMGGSISKNERYLLPQNHNAQALLKVGKVAWKEKILPKLDTEQMVDDFGKPMTPAKLNEALDYVYDTITTGGINKAKDLTVTRLGTKLSRKGSEKRFLYFKDADSWLSYQKEFSKGDVLSTLTDSLSGRANDIALMRVFGPNPDNAFDAIRMTIEKNDKVFSGTEKSMSDAIYKVVSGKVNQGQLTGFADFMQTIRNLLTAANLGKAFLSAISDTTFQAITANYNGLPFMKVMGRQMALMNPANEADRIMAVRMGLTADAWITRALAGNRYADVYGTGASTKIAEGVLRASLLSSWTDAGRKAFGMEFSGFLADNFSKPLSELDKALQDGFSRYGISEADWDKFRAQKPLDYKGAKFADMTKNGGEKFHQMILSETDYAVPTPDARVKAITTGGYERASIAGQLIRSATNLKSFSITIATTHFYRGAMGATIGSKVGYYSTLLITTGAMGGVALQLKDIAAGRDPRPMDNPKFVAAAFAQGGGLGIFGDYLFSDVNRFGQKPFNTILGPTGELGNRVMGLTVGNIQEALAGDETNLFPEAIDFAERYTPSVWQIHMFKASLFDQLQIMADPKDEKKFQRIIKKRETEYNQGYWWQPGEMLPERAPRLEQ